jgi:Lhr-like helicase
VRAIVIYPMNALVNSQFKALQEYGDRYLARTGKPMPVRFGRYTGQESQEERARMQQEVPHILLTNYTVTSRYVISLSFRRCMLSPRMTNCSVELPARSGAEIARNLCKRHFV